MPQTEQKFAVLSPELQRGVYADIPHLLLPHAFQPDSLNTFVHFGCIERMRGRLKELCESDGTTHVQTPDGNPILAYHRHITKTGLNYLHAATKAHIYLWSTSLYAWQTRFTCGSDCTEWSFVSYGGRVVATNNIDLVQYWVDSTPGTNFADLDGASGLDLGGATYLTRAKYVAEQEGYLLFGFTTEGGSVFPTRVRWSSYNDSDDYDETGSGDTGAKDFAGRDHMIGFGHYGSLLIVFKRQSVHEMELSISDLVWRTGPVYKSIGCLASKSIVNDGLGRLYWWASDYTIREFRSGVVSDAIDPILKGVSSDVEGIVQSTFISEYNQLFFAIPYGADQATNNRIVAYSPEDEQRWEIHNFAVQAFGQYVRQDVYSIDTIPFATIDGIEWPQIDTIENITGFPLDVVSDADGYTWDLHAASTDAGEAFTGSAIISTDAVGKNKGVLPHYKRVSELELICKSEGVGTVLIECKADDAANWEGLGSVSLTDEANADIIYRHLPVDIRGKTFLLRFSATNRFRLVGVIGTFYFDGTR